MTDVESLSASLVREYLSRKGFKRSLRLLDEEFPRTGASIRNRVILAKELKIEKMMRLNKETDTPLRTMLEIMVKYFVTEKPAKKTHISGTDNPRRKSTSRKIVGINDKLESSSAMNEFELDRELDNALNLTNGGNEAPKSQHFGAFDNKPSEDTTSIHGSLISRSQTDRMNSLKINEDGKQQDQAVAGNLFQEPLLDRRQQKPRSKGQIQSTVDTKKRIACSVKKKNLNYFGDGFCDTDIEKSEFPLKFDEFEQNYGPSSRKSEPNTLSSRDFADSKQTARRKLKENEKNDKRQTSLDLKTKASSDIMIFDDLEDEDFTIAGDEVDLDIPSNRTIKQLHESCKSITLDVAVNLKTLIFGSSTSNFNTEWKTQNFSFCDLPSLEYGIVQLKGGPCGVLAAVQATVLKQLLFRKSSDTKLNSALAPSSKERSNALAHALSEILWRAGNKRFACVVLPGLKAKFIGGGRYRSDGLTETLSIYSFKDSENLKTFMSQNVGQFENASSSGCILFVYSLIFSRTIKRIQSDMDEATGTLIGAHGYCTQDLVNLCLTGKSVSNVFDGNIELDSGGTTKSTLKGIERQSDIGLLSLFEHYGSCTVGDNYKKPKFPIWVVCSESHFSTLFSSNQRLLQNADVQKRFDLYYYDGLARQNEEIRLTINLDGDYDVNNHHNDELIPPLEHCIRTKWKNASVDWNSTEPIL